MKIIRSMLAVFAVVMLLPTHSLGAPSEAKWITSPEENVNEMNTWIAFRKDIRLDELPAQAMINIGADSKYWLWINGEMVVFEGGLKRGPNRSDGYYDKLDIAPYLSEGENKIAVLLWYFGKQGFSHISSRRAGVIIDSDVAGLSTDDSWICCIHPSYGNTGEPHSNFRLPESNIRFDAGLDIGEWQTEESPTGFVSAAEIGSWGDAPWNSLEERPIPFWKDFGIKEVEFEVVESDGDRTVVAHLPYNMQMTPIITLNDTEGGSLVGIATDNSIAAGDINVRAEYITKKGSQSYESLGWMNGHRIILSIPETVTVSAVAYRETGYDSEPSGSFSCDDPYFELFWEKALRTLYVNMRDNYFDCPDRERAQWWGDAVLLMGESFYSFSTSTHALMRKAMLELAAFQRADNTLFSPMPTVVWNEELPAQMLASVGSYGFWNYYMNTGDVWTIAKVYPAVKSYLGVWSLDDTGLTDYRKGDWSWGDWGEDIDIRLVLGGWHYLALQGAADMADLLGHTDDAADYRCTMERVKEGFNGCWNGSEYRHPEHTARTDDRVHALAVLSGIANPEKYPAISKVFRTEFNSSPYMEKYVMEALFVMGKGEYAMERTRSRFAKMVEHPYYTTLWEGWGIGSEGYGGGTVNHAWSGGPLTVIAQYLFGIYPIEAGWRVFRINPDPVTFGSAALSFPTVAGDISMEFDKAENALKLTITVPDGTIAIVNIPTTGSRLVKVNGRKARKAELDTSGLYDVEGKLTLRLEGGSYLIEAERK